MKWRCSSCGQAVRLRGVSRVHLEAEFPELEDEMLDILSTQRRWRCAPCKIQGFVMIDPRGFVH